MPVMIKQVIEGLVVMPGGRYADLTFGGGGHSAAILDKVGNGKLFAFDQDTDALQNRIQDSRLTLIHSNFRFATNFLTLYNALPLDGMFADLGVSSHQIDSPERGFSTRFDAPLDLRMNKALKVSARDIVNSYSASQLRSLFFRFGEISNAGVLANELVNTRSTSPIESTTQLVGILNRIVPPHKINRVAAQVFQALRIEVNDELNALADLVSQATEILRPGGRLVIISYHSIEDRIVKNFMRTGNIKGDIEKDYYGNVRSPFRPINKRPLVPEDDEVARNPRSRSAKLRIAERNSI
ncbi:MAG TPA: 16S rRNA (cytosine(1402)-N(4))-methyltransferase RsmH [Bacteroidales bacterium]|nr:16S rRNA (cytosine(1402)-N(4))-methyltransferase RsmH [Bacteroidales bacterium]